MIDIPNDSLTRTIQACVVPNGDRPKALPRHFGRHMLTVEGAVYAFMRTVAPAYSGGYWNFFDLSNGGFYMAPQSDGLFAVFVDGNGYEGEMSPDATGITACLFALSHLSFRLADGRIATHYHQLRDFALEHAEVREIMGAID